MIKNRFLDVLLDPYGQSNDDERQNLPITRSPSPEQEKESPSGGKKITRNDSLQTVADSREYLRKIKKGRTIVPLPISLISEEDQKLAVTTEGTNEITGKESAKSSPNRAKLNWKKLQRSLQLLKVEDRLEFLLEERDREFQMAQNIHNDTILEKMKEQIKGRYLDPRNPLLILWRFFFQLGVIYYCLTFSYRLAFGINLFQLDAVDIVENTMDICYGINMVLQFIIAVKKPDGTLIKNKKVLAIRYFNGMFIIDVIAVIPYEYFLPQISGIKMLRILHLGAFLDLVKSVAALIATFFTQGFQTAVVSKFLGEATTMLLFMALVFHLMADVWIVLGYPTSPSEMTWFANIPRDPEEVKKLTKGSLEVYVASIFFVVQSILPVGYGSAVGYTLREYLFSTAMQLFGIFMFTACFEKVKSIIASFNRADLVENEEVEELEVWLRRIERTLVENCQIFNKSLLEKIQAILRHRVEQDWQESFIGNSEFKLLNHKTKEQILLRSFSRLKRRFHILFKDTSDEFFHQIMIQSESMVFLTGEVILKRKQASKGLFLIMKGSVLIMSNIFDEPFTRLGESSFFGEVSTFIGKKSPLNYIAENEVHCLFIGKEAFEEIQGKYSEDIKKLKLLAYYRYKYFLFEKEKHETAQKIELNHSQDNFGGRELDLKNKKTFNDLNKSSFDDSKKSFMVKMSDSPNPNLQQDLNKLLTDLELTPSPFVPANNQRQYFTFSDKEVVDVSSYQAPMSVESKRRFLAAGQSKWEINTRENLETLNTKRENARKSVFFYEDQAKGSLPYLEKVLALNEPDSSDSDISEPESEKQNNYNLDEGEGDEDDVLNDSMDFPIEGVIPDMTNAGEVPKILSYLNERVGFLREKLEKMKSDLTIDVQYISRKVKISRKKLT